MSGGAAAALVSTARRLRKLAVTAAAWDSQELSGAQVRAITSNLDDKTEAVFADHEADVVPALAPCSVADTARAMRHWRLRAEALVDDPEPREQRRRLHISRTFEGRHELSASLWAEDGEVVAKALRLAESADADGEPPRTAATRRADALVDLCRYFLDHQLDHSGGRHRPHLNVVVDFDDLAHGGPGEIVGGSVLDGASVARLACDAALHRVVAAGRSVVLDYGRTTRTVPAPLWAALVLRDSHCRFPGCDRQPGWCEGHHLHHFAHGGPTNLANLVLACSRHHHLLHQPGWSAKLKPDGEVVVTTPEGRVLVSRLPNAPPLPLAG
jgi:hypothetical protein